MSSLEQAKRLMGIDQTGRIDDDGSLTIYDFENRDDAWGAPHATNLIYKWFPNAHQVKGMNVHQTPIGKLVGTCRRVVLISKRNRKAIEWMQNNIDMDIDSLRTMWIAESNGTCGCEDGWAICDKHMEQAERLGVDLT